MYCNFKTTYSRALANWKINLSIRFFARNYDTVLAKPSVLKGFSRANFFLQC